MRNIRFRKDDQKRIMREIGPMIPALLREAVDEGFHNFAVSRQRDIEAYPEYTECSRANMLYDRITAAARVLVDALADDRPDLYWRVTPNKRSTEILLDARFAFRFKRSKENRGNLTANVCTLRQQHEIKSDVMLPWGQLVLPFRNTQPEVPDRERIWLTVAFDLDDLEEAVTNVGIGVELRKSFLWKVPLVAPDAEIITSFPPSLADRIGEMRNRRSA